MILSKKKTRIGEKVKFASHIISKDSILPDPKKTAALSHFPTSQNLTWNRTWRQTQHYQNVVLEVSLKLRAGMPLLSWNYLAIQWAMSKCNHYLQGMQSFTVITDHKPLLGIFSKDLADIDNNRLK